LRRHFYIWEHVGLHGEYMFFKVLSHSVRVPPASRSKAFLLTDEWDDWFKYSTMYYLVVFDHDGNQHDIGSVKIGQFNMEEGQRRADIPVEFDELNDYFFSLGQDDSYYVNLNNIGDILRDKVLFGLRDVALDTDLFKRALDEKVTGVSLLRSVSSSTVHGQFSRLARGGARLSSYEFTYKAPMWPKSNINPVELLFTVEPESTPPTNVHVLIGRNGVGKTRILHHMARALVEEKADATEVGSFTSVIDDFNAGGIFANIVSVTFSAFDPFQPLPVRQDKSTGVQYAYIGLKHTGTTKDGKALGPKSPRFLSVEFGKSALVCSKGARADRWRSALETLEADPIFKSSNVAGLAKDNIDEVELKSLGSKLFSKLSSGHKIVLLTITRLVETVEERTLVLLDEPEAHLHPPLLSAFVRALSDLLINRNGVAIVATHSPVVLQEVPTSCVWKIRRSGRRVKAERPDIETFGENVGVLTREVFGLEVTQAGFHKLLYDAVSEERDFRGILRRFGGELGGEARAIAKTLLAANDARDER
jgi:ABC-type branched-subunit amino acid transport system ATPase component